MDKSWIKNILAFSKKDKPDLTEKQQELPFVSGVKVLKEEEFSMLMVHTRLDVYCWRCEDCGCINVVNRPSNKHVHRSDIVCFNCPSRLSIEWR